MAEVKDADAGKSSLKDKSFSVTDSVSKFVRAVTGAATEAAVGTVKVGTTFMSDVAQSTGDTVTATVDESTKVARATVDRFFNTLDSGSDSSSTSGSRK